MTVLRLFTRCKQIHRRSFRRINRIITHSRTTRRGTERHSSPPDAAAPGVRVLYRPPVKLRRRRRTDTEKTIVGEERSEPNRAEQLTGRLQLAASPTVPSHGPPHAAAGC